MWSMRVSMLMVTVVVKSHANVRMPDVTLGMGVGSDLEFASARVVLPVFV